MQEPETTTLTWICFTNITLRQIEAHRSWLMRATKSAALSADGEPFYQYKLMFRDDLRERLASVKDPNSWDVAPLPSEPHDVIA